MGQGHTEAAMAGRMMLQAPQRGHLLTELLCYQPASGARSGPAPGSAEIHSDVGRAFAAQLAPT